MDSIPLSSGKEIMMPKKPLPVSTNNYMVFWIDGNIPHWVEFLDREPAVKYYRQIRKRYTTTRLYRMVIDSVEKV
jgi:hypothetical protein